MSSLRNALVKAGFKPPAKAVGVMNKDGNIVSHNPCKNVGGMEYLHGVNAADTKEDNWRARSNSRPVTVTRSKAQGSTYQSMYGG